MDYIYVGTLVNTHGIKGEIRIISDFELKSRVFVVGRNLFIGKDKDIVTIKSYRPHKNFDMCTFENFDDIRDVLRFKGQKVYVKREDIMEKDEYVYTDLIGYQAYYNNSLIGKIDNVENNNGYKILHVQSKYIPYNRHFISLVDHSKKQVILINLEGIL